MWRRSSGKRCALTSRPSMITAPLILSDSTIRADREQGTVERSSACWQIARGCSSPDLRSVSLWWSMNAPKRTVLYDLHHRLGARMTEFGGFTMPVQYRGIIEEHV